MFYRRQMPHMFTARRFWLPHIQKTRTRLHMSKKSSIFVAKIE